jgi:hypothetical protein
MAVVNMDCRPRRLATIAKRRSQVVGLVKVRQYSTCALFPLLSNLRSSTRRLRLGKAEGEYAPNAESSLGTNAAESIVCSTSSHGADEASPATRGALGLQVDTRPDPIFPHQGMQHAISPINVGLAEQPVVRKSYVGQIHLSNNYRIRFGRHWRTVPERPVPPGTEECEWYE